MKYLPVRLHTALSHLKMALIVLLNGVYDSLRVIKHTHFWNGPYSLNQLEAKLWAQAHVLEKGLSLPQPRLGYGAEGVQALFELCRCYSAEGFSPEWPAYTNALNVLHAYVEFHKKQGFDVDLVKQKLSALSAAPLCADVMDAGVVQFQKQTYQNLAHGDFAALAGSRHSLRIFGDEAVKEDAVFSALEIARKTPSACNRQPWHVYWVRAPEAKNKLLEIQSGHRGFGAGADSFLIVTADIQSYFGVVERHQTFIDGGLYAMSLLYALHYVGLGACPLNWCVAFKTDMKLRKIFAIPDSENIIMIIAIGNLPQEIKAAKSLRKSVADTVRRL